MLSLVIVAVILIAIMLVFVFILFSNIIKRMDDNAKKYFNINEIEKDMILKHMFPLTLKFPKYKETFVIILVDKWCTMKEFFDGLYNKY